MECTKCKVDKDTSNFRVRLSLKSGLNSWCRDCENKAQRDKYIPTIKVEKTIDPLEIKQKAFERMLKHRYKLSREEFDTMLLNQMNKCKVCSNTIKKGENLVVDHCHTSNKVRGLVCRRCNTLLGYLETDQTILNSAYDYLKMNNRIH